jgi:hypothetical protein
MPAAADEVLKMRRALSPLSVTLPAGPVIVSAPEMAISQDVSVIVCGVSNSDEKATVSAPAAPLASRIAWRSEPALESLMFETVNVAYNCRSSSGSTGRRRE